MKGRIMPSFYSAITFLSIFAMLIMISTILTDRILPYKKRKGFVIVCTSIIMCSAIEWLSVFSEHLGPEYRYLTIVTTVLLFSLMPIVPIILATTITELEHMRKIKIFFILHFILECLSAVYGFIFYVDLNNVYFRRELYFIYCIISLGSAGILFESVYQLSKKYQSKNNYILVLNLIFLVLGTAIQVVNPDIYVIWATSTVTTILLYTYYYSLINQVDPVTSLFNRRCYESEIYGIKNDAIILLIDIDNFKEINDINGHSYGDYCLHEISNAIKNTYNNYGTCYRIGGDEFCVILESKLNEIDNLNKDLIRNIEELKQKDIKIPSISYGYDYFYATNPNIVKTIEDADKKMYIYKNNAKTQLNNFYI